MKGALKWYKELKHHKFKRCDHVLLKNDRHNTVFQIHSVYESGYSLIHVRTGIVLPNIIGEEKIISAMV